MLVHHTRLNNCIINIITTLWRWYKPFCANSFHRTSAGVMQVLWHAVCVCFLVYFWPGGVFEQIIWALQIPGLNKYSVGYCLRDHFWRVTNAYITAALGLRACRCHYRLALWGACVRWGSGKRAELINVPERRQIMKSLMWNGRWKAYLCK